MKRWRMSGGLAHGLCDAGLVVDLRRQQHRPAVIEAPRHQFLEMPLVAYPVAVGDAGAARMATMSALLAVAAVCLPVIW